MHPLLAQLLMAARGHTGLPMQIGGGSSAPGGIPAPMPAAAALTNATGGRASDRAIATEAANHLLAATARASDPALKAAFTTALAALHKYIAQDDKEHQQALAGKVSPRIMAQAHARKAA